MRFQIEFGVELIMLHGIAIIRDRNEGSTVKAYGSNDFGFEKVIY